MPNRNDLLQRLQTRCTDPARAVDHHVDIVRPIPPPVSAEQLARVEELLGFDLPALLRSLYLQIGNGGFGPGYGLFALPLGEPGCADLVGMYWYVRGDARQPDPGKYFNPAMVDEIPLAPEDEEWDDADQEPDFVWNWPANLLPILSHGCGAYECIDWTKPDEPVFLHDPDFFPPGGKVEDTLIELAPSLERRLEAWLAGEDFSAHAKKSSAQGRQT